MALSMPPTDAGGYGCKFQCAPQKSSAMLCAVLPFVSLNLPKDDTKELAKDLTVWWLGWPGSSC